MEKLTFFTSLDLIVHSIILCSTYLLLAALPFSLKKLGDTWALFSITNSLLEVILISTPTKQISTIKYMKLLGSSTRGINSLQKRRLYRCCALPIVLYEFLLWYYNKAPIYYHLNILRKIQQRAALWITGAFHTSSTLGIKAIAGLVPIHLYLKKLYGRFLL